MMKNVAIAITMACLSVVACNKQEAQKAQEEPKEPEFMFVQTALGAAFVDGTLTLQGISPTTVFFSDRPDRIAGHGLTLEFISEWDEGEGSFASDPPNASLSMLVEGEMVTVVAELTNPRLEGDDLLYDVEVLEGNMPAQAEGAALFIDIIGRPLTPLSVAGVARRSRRRAIRRMTYAPTVVVVR
jgi:hypothetical protein